MIRGGIMRLLRHHALCGLIVGLFLFAAGGAYVLAQPTSHTAAAVVALHPRPQAPVSAQMVVLVASSYEVFLSSAEVAATVAAERGESGETVASATTVELEPESANVRIEVKLPSAEQAATVANSLATVATARAARDRFVMAEVVSPALAWAVEVNPPRLLLLTVAAAGAVVGGSVVWYVLAYRGPAKARERRENQT
jgi:capsular polysaccharide biosynthesis protein